MRLLPMVLAVCACAGSDPSPADAGGARADAGSDGACGIAAEACRVLAREGASDRCIERGAPDGTPCSDGCRPNGRCEGGECVGPVACDDGDPCTHDSCVGGQRCAHATSPATCTAPMDPCLAPVCDRTTGCGLEPVADGVACGASDCRVSRVCRRGMCTAEPSATACPTPACAAVAGPCPDGAFDLSWKYRAAPMVAVHFSGLADEFANQYWFECRGPWQCELVSVNRRGELRYRRALPVLARSWFGDFEPGTRPLTLVRGKGGPYLALAPGASTIELRRADDGTLVWRRNLARLADPEQPDVVDRIATDGLGQLVVRAARWDGDCGNDGFSSLCRASTNVFVLTLAGEVVRTIALGRLVHGWDEPWAFDGLVVNEKGELFSGGDGQPTASFAPDGSPRWSTYSQWQGYRPLAALGDRLAAGWDGSSLSIIDATTGAAGPDLDWTDGVLLQDRFAIVRGGGLARIDVETQQVSWRNDSGGRPVLTSRGSVLVAGSGRGAATVRELSVDSGCEILSCPLATIRSDVARLALRGGLLVVSSTEFDADTSRGAFVLHAFEAPGYDPAPRGWVVFEGSPDHDWRAR